MHRLGFLLLRFIRLLAISVFGALLVILRYILKTPQPLESKLPGEAHLFKWTHGHVFYKVHGNVDAPSLVLLHTPQIGGSAYEFRGLVEQLAPHYRVYAIDLLGFGLSDHPNVYYSGETYTTLYQDFLTQVVQQPAILVASGLSCNYSIAVASTHPELCQRLVLISPDILFKEGKRQEGIARLLQQPFVGLFVYAFLTMRPVLREVLARQKQEHVVADEELDYIYAAAHQLGAQYAVTALLAGHLLLDISPYVETLKVPKKVISIPSTEISDTSDIGLEEQSHTEEYEEEPIKESAVENSQVEAYCVKCKEKRIMQNPVDTVTKNGRNAKTGTCPVCGTKLFRFVAS